MDTKLSLLIMLINSFIELRGDYTLSPYPYIAEKADQVFDLYYDTFDNLDVKSFNMRLAEKVSERISDTANPFDIEREINNALDDMSKELRIVDGYKYKG